MLARATSVDSVKSTAKSKTLNFLKFFGGGIYAPDSSTYDPIDILLNTDDVEEKDRLTENWRDNRLNELGFVGVVVGSLACADIFRGSNL